MRIVVLWNILRYMISLTKFFFLKDTLNYSIIYLIKQIFGSLLQKGTMWQFWYLGTLILLYVLMPGLSLAVKMFKKKIDYFAYILWGIMAVSCVTIQICSMISGRALQQSVIQTFRLWSWLQYFLLGGLMPHIFPVVLKKILLRMHLLLLAIASVFIVNYQYFIGKYVLNNWFAEYFYDSIFVIIWVFIFFTFMLRIQIPSRYKKLVTVLSGCTLGVYIIHPMVMTLVRHILFVDNFIIAVIYFVVVLMISFIIVYFLEKFDFVKRWLFML